MPGRIEKTVFISYRRTNVPWALAVYQNLTIHGYDAFFDFQSINSGPFSRVILENIKARSHFVIILTPSALERCDNPDDWLRHEIETAIDTKRNIVPLMLEGFDFGSPLISKYLVEKLALLRDYNGLRIHSDYFDEGMARLRDRYLNIALDTVLHPVSVDVAKAVQIQQASANQEKQVNQRQLIAQQWYEKGKSFSMERKLEEAVHAFDKAIELDTDLTEAWLNKAQLLVILGRKREASETINKLISLYEEQIVIEKARYEIYKEQWTSGAPSIYNSPIQEVLGYYDTEGLGPHSVAMRLVEEQEEKIKSLKTLLKDLQLSE